MKEEVPPTLLKAHIQSVEDATKEGKEVTPTFNLEKTGIAGTGNEDEEKEAEKKEGVEVKPKEEPTTGEEKKDEGQEEKKDQVCWLM